MEEDLKKELFKKYFLLEEIWSVSHVLEFKKIGQDPPFSKELVLERTQRKELKKFRKNCAFRFSHIEKKYI